MTAERAGGVVLGLDVAPPQPPFLDVAEALAAHARNRPDALAFVEAQSGARITFAELDRAAQALADGLAARAEPGSRVALAALPGIDAAVAYTGIARAGMAPVLLPTPETPEAIEPMAPLVAQARSGIEIALAIATPAALAVLGEAGDRDWGARAALLPTDRLAAEGAGLAPRVERDAGRSAAEGHFVFTSGTTGPAKAVRLSRRAVALNAAITAAAWSFDATCRIAALGAPYHSAGLMVGYVMPMLVGATAVVLSPARLAADPSRLLHAIEEHGVTHVACPDSLVERCVALPPGAFEDRDLSTWRLVVIGGEPLAHETLARLEARLADGAARVDVGAAYGMTEAAGLIATSGRRRPLAGEVALDALSCGRAQFVDDGPRRFVAGAGGPAPGVALAVVDEHDVALPPLQLGRVLFASPSLFDGYEGMPVASNLTRAVVGPDGRARPGFLETGDLGFLAPGENGLEIVVVGRAKEAVRHAGRVLHAGDVERLAEAADPALAGSRVIAAQDDRPDGALLVVAEIAGDPGEEPARIAAAIHDVLERAFENVPIRVVLVPSGTLPVVPTSSKKPRLRAAASLREGRVPVVHDTCGGLAALAHTRGDPS